MLGRVCLFISFGTQTSLAPGEEDVDAVAPGAGSVRLPAHRAAA